MREHVLGYVLLVTGILIMALSVFQVYRLFTNQIKPYTIFQSAPERLSNPSVTNEELLSNPSAFADIQSAILNNVLEKQMGRTLNVTATAFFQYFVMLLGFRLASLGVMLVRPIKVNLKTNMFSEERNK